MNGFDNMGHIIHRNQDNLSDLVKTSGFRLNDFTKSKIKCRNKERRVQKGDIAVLKLIFTDLYKLV